MIVRAERPAAISQTFLLDRVRKRAVPPLSLHAAVISSVAGLRQSLASATRNSLWISFQQSLTESLLKNLSWPAHSLGSGVFVHPVSAESIPVLSSCFERFAFAADGGFLPAEELLETLAAENREDLFIGGSVDPSSQTITLWRGSLEPLIVPFAAFEVSGDGTAPDFRRFSVTDSGQTVRLGEYEAAADALLYEFDPEFRRRANRQRQQNDQSFGAALRRLRKQRGLRREDFAPEITAKTVARIEQGKVQRIQKKTLECLARRLQVQPDEIATF